MTATRAEARSYPWTEVKNNGLEDYLCFTQVTGKACELACMCMEYRRKRKCNHLLTAMRGNYKVSHFFDTGMNFMLPLYIEKDIVKVECFISPIKPGSGVYELGVALAVGQVGTKYEHRFVDLVTRYDGIRTMRNRVLAWLPTIKVEKCQSSYHNTGDSVFDFRGWNSAGTGDTAVYFNMVRDTLSLAKSGYCHACGVIIDSLEVD